MNTLQLGQTYPTRDGKGTGRDVGEFLGDDDHEAWSALNAALSLWQPAAPVDSEVRK